MLINKRESNYSIFMIMSVIFLGPGHFIGNLSAAEAMSADQQLLHASREGKVDEVRNALVLGARIEVTDDLGRTPLSIAAMDGHIGTVDRLLRVGANTGATDYNGVTPLFGAAMNGHTGVIGQLLFVGADIEATNGYGLTPLLWAAMAGHTDVVRLLLSRGAAWPESQWSMLPGPAKELLESNKHIYDTRRMLVKEYLEKVGRQEDLPEVLEDLIGDFAGQKRITQ